VDTEHYYPSIDANGLRPAAVSMTRRAASVDVRTWMSAFQKIARSPDGAATGIGPKRIWVAMSAVRRSALTESSTDLPDRNAAGAYRAPAAAM